MAKRKKRKVRIEPRPAWLLERLRKTLKFYHDEAEFDDGKPLSWPGLCEAVAAHTGVKVPHERVRQFVEGIDNPVTGKRSHPVPRPDRIEALIDTITDPKDFWITRQALETPEFEFRPPACLLDLLTDPSLPAPTGKLVGVFTARTGERLEFQDVTLTFEAFDLPGMVHVREHQDSQWAGSAADLVRSGTGEGSGRLATIEASGWGVLTAEDQIIVLMRNPKSGRTHRWLLVAHVDFWSEQPLDELVLLRQDYAYDVDFSLGAAPVHDQISSQLTPHIVRFFRGENALG